MYQIKKKSKEKVTADNVVIITEDSASGKQLFSYISKELYNNSYTVASAAGNRRFGKTVSALFHSNDIHRGTVVVLAFDNIVLDVASNPAKTIEENMENVKMLNQKLQSWQNFIENTIHGLYIKSEYMSMEEALLSYAPWPDITKTYMTYNYSSYDKELLDIYNNMSDKDRETLCGESQPGFKFYSKLLYPVVAKYNKSYEAVLSDMLNAVSKQNYATHMEITKQSIGFCLYMDCKTASEEKGVNCTNCALTREKELYQLSSAHSKIYSLVRNSRLNNLFNQIQQTISKNI